MASEQEVRFIGSDSELDGYLALPARDAWLRVLAFFDETLGEP